MKRTITALLVSVSLVFACASVAGASTPDERFLDRLEYDSILYFAQQANPAILVRSSGVSLGVMAINAGTVAIGSTITKSELTANNMYSGSVMRCRGPTRLRTYRG